MKIATWNVNSLKVRLPQVLSWLADNPVDVLCLQETKLTDENFPLDQITATGYHAAYAGQRTYNGVAILSKFPINDVSRASPFSNDEQQRFIAATIEGIRIVCIYVPNGQSLESDKFQYKLQWLDSMHNWLAEELNTHDELALLGDFNIAPEDRDVHDPELWRGHVLASEPERAQFRRLQELNLHDAFRLFDQPEKAYSWWDYRQLAFRRNMGLRIDHILLSGKLVKRCTSCTIDRSPRKWEQPSDHTPVIASID